MIYTSYFGRLNRLSSEIIPIAICAKIPNWYTGLIYKPLAPKKNFFIEWKQNHNNNFYIYHFYKDVLNCLSVIDVVNELYTMTSGKDICLVCYERPEDFCHRHLVADWLNQNGYSCEEII